MGDRAVTVVAAAAHRPSHGIWCHLWWFTCYRSILLDAGDTSIFTKMYTLTSSYYKRCLGHVYPVQLEAVQAVQCQEKTPVQLPKAVLETGVFSVLDLTCWSDYAALSLQLSCLILVWNLLPCVPPCNIDRRRGISVSLDWDIDKKWWQLHSTGIFACNLVLSCYLFWNVPNLLLGSYREPFGNLSLLFDECWNSALLSVLW